MLPAIRNNAADRSPARSLTYAAMRAAFELPLSDAGGGAVSTALQRGTGTATFTRATSATTFDKTGAMVTVASGTPRSYYDPVTLAYLGYLSEGARTNSVRNSTMVGVAAGTPGTIPTNWFSSIPAEITREIVGSGTEGGIPYVDVRHYGTVTALRDISLLYETAAVAVNGQAWATSSFVRLVGGSFTNITIANLLINAADAGFVFLNSVANTSILGVTSAALRMQRIESAGTTSNASTAYVSGGFFIRTAAAGAVDITLRIGAPQLELGEFVTSFIPTSTVAVVRNADVLTYPSAGNISATTGTAYLEETLLASPASSSVALSIGGGSSIGAIVYHNTGQVTIHNCYDGTTVASVTGLTSLDTTEARATAWGGATMQCAAGGTLATGAAFDGDLSGILDIGVGANASGSQQLNGCIKNVSIFSSKLTSAQLQEMT